MCNVCDVCAYSQCVCVPVFQVHIPDEQFLSFVNEFSIPILVGCILKVMSTVYVRSGASE